MRDTYIPLFASTLDSSLWSLDGNCLKVFLTLALKADPEGYVSAAIDGVARAAALPVAEVIQHLKRLEGPDEFSKDLARSPANGGRRLERVAGGWRVINIEWYREEARRQAELARKRRWWDEKGSGARRGARRTETETETETETHPERREDTSPPPGSAGTIPAVLRTLPEGYTPSPSLLAQVASAGCPREVFEARLAELRTGPIGGARGVLPNQLEKYLLTQASKWRNWNAADVAKQANGRPRRDAPNQPNAGITGLEKAKVVR